MICGLCRLPRYRAEDLDTWVDELSLDWKSLKVRLASLASLNYQANYQVSIPDS
jgi:hypothetical protein